MNNKPPLEFHEQSAFVQWLEQQNIVFTAVGNDVYTKSWKQKQKKHAEGLRAGFPDMIVLIMPEQSKDSEGYILCIEMKRVKEARPQVRENQKTWNRNLNRTSAHAYICYGADDAIAKVSHYLKVVDNSVF